MKRYLSALLAALAVGFSGPAAWAQPADDAAHKLVLAKRYMELAEVTKLMNMMMVSMVEAMELDEETPAPIAKALRESAIESTQAVFPAMVDRMADIYAQAFTREELEGIVAFLASPTGRALTEKSGQLMNSSAALLSEEFGPRLEQDMMERLCRKIDCESEDTKRALQNT